jgi:polyhydroxyalkanoate synthesis regulator phasin
MLRTALAVAAGAVLWSVLWGQQPGEEPATVEDRLEQGEKRLALLEKALETSVDPPTRLPDAALESRLGRLESRVDRLEAQSLRQPAGSSSLSDNRMLESRVRALEQQVSRLRR